MLSNQSLVIDYSASGLAPVSGSGPSVLILGSYPSEQSLQRQEYYGNPRNQFWKIMGMVFSFPFEYPELPYHERLNYLTREGIAIWDVVESCSRKRSSDSSICDVTPNDIRGFLREHPTIRCIALNGKTGAGHWFKRYFSDVGEPENKDTDFVILQLPSTSPAYAGMSLDDKAELWRGILPFCVSSK
ncbi:DNA-deoxyinosine glycosylase [Methanogenium organophilum]|uniref:DNA-deoxyinosine glycosylase n=1 Tax=Methanogenium organophilum TaxID=2199 RepID=A0A9X9S378_METOG|nr:DNA-deoxyinosine glycosylase [Methanogenium organophilum]WAI01069.1 DNA-deoxyinosine glycosylase [Methanogenium organophilum]